MPENYLYLNKKISLSQVNLNKYLEFYKTYICVNKYIYHLENTENISIVFEKNNLPHLLGLHKLPHNLKANEILEKIETFEWEIEYLKSTYGRHIAQISDRLTFFPVLHTLLEEATVFIEFDQTNCIPTTLSCDFLLFSNHIAITVYLAIRKKTNDEIICSPVSFVVDRINKYQKEKHLHHNIIKLIKEKKSE